MKLLQDKVAIITGASRGIGRAIALELASYGANVVVNYASSSAAAESLVTEITSAGGQAIALQADVSKIDQVEALFNAVIDKFKRIDILVNNAGITRDTLLLRMKPEDWQAVIDLNLTGVFYAHALLVKSCSSNVLGGLLILPRLLGKWATLVRLTIAPPKQVSSGLPKL